MMEADFDNRVKPPLPNNCFRGDFVLFTIISKTNRNRGRNLLYHISIVTQTKPEVKRLFLKTYNLDLTFP